MPNMLNADSSWMNANAKVREWSQKFMRQWTEPLDEITLVMWWANLTPEMHLALQAINPEEHARLEEKVNEIKARSERNGTH